MAKPHLRALEEALARRGWRIVAVHPGDEYQVAKTWEIQRSGQSSLFLDFDGMDSSGDFCHPLEESSDAKCADGLHYRSTSVGSTKAVPCGNRILRRLCSLWTMRGRQTVRPHNCDSLQCFRAKMDFWKDVQA